MPVIDPSIALVRFNCPHCGAFAHHTWYGASTQWSHQKKTGADYRTAWRDWAEAALTAAVMAKPVNEETHRLAFEKYQRSEKGYIFPTVAGIASNATALGGITFSLCLSCNDWGVWIDETLIWPAAIAAPLPNEDMPEDVKQDYLEAARIVPISPRGAAALLRLAIQKLCNEATGKEQDIKAFIDELEEKKLSRPIVDALHIVRVVGNESVHPGKLDIRDDPEMASELFVLVNRIVDTLISQPKRDQEMWAKLPESKRTQIEEDRKRKEAKKPPA